MYLYHGTNTRRLPSIKKQGLKTIAPKASKGEDYIYLTDKPDIAALFSGYGRDSQGFNHEGYMSPLDAKKKTGIVLKVTIDPEYLDDDQIWSQKVRELKNKKSLYKKVYDAIYEDYSRGNQVLDFEVENELFKLWKESGLEEEGEAYDSELMGEEEWNHAINTVIGKRAKKEVETMLNEAKVYLSGKLYQYSKDIPFENVVAVYPAERFLKDIKTDTKQFGSGFEIGGNTGGTQTLILKALTRLVEADYSLNKLLPPHPLFHATPAATQILAHGEGIRSDKGSRWWKKNDRAVSLTRDISWLLDGKFGNAILVLDRDELRNRFKIEPVDPLGYMSEFRIRKGEREERIYTDHIPVKYIKAMITLVKPYQKAGIVEYRNPESGWPQAVKYIYLDPDSKKISVY